MLLLLLIYFGIYFIHSTMSEIEFVFFVLQEMDVGRMNDKFFTKCLIFFRFTKAKYHETDQQKKKNLEKKRRTRK